MTVDLPLTGLRILDLAQGPTAGIARYLGELGADVLRAEPPDRDTGQAGDTYAEGISLDYAAANLGKRRVALDPAGPQGQARLDALLEAADVLIETGEVDGAAAQARHPHLVVLSVSGFGREGPLSGWQATGPVLRALSGELSRSGIPGRAPLLPPGDLSSAVAIAQAVFVVLAAYANRLRTGQGDWLDFSLMDATALGLDPGYGIAGSATVGVPASKLPRGRPESRHQYPIVPCLDGFVRICVLAPRQWQGMFEWLGRPEEFADPSFGALQKRFATPTLIPAIGRLFAGKTRAELEVEGQKFGVPTAALLDLGEATQSAQAKARQLFKTFEIAPGMTAPFPDGLVEIDGVRAGPAFGIAVPAANAEWLPRSAIPAGPPPGERPLSGLRVLDFGVIVVGAEQGRMLADLGAEVYKVETAAFADGARQSMDLSQIPVTFAAGHRNKKGLGVNLRDPQGKALLLKLVAQSDIIVSNFKPGVLESLGLGYDALKTVNPGIIMIDSSAFGPSGPWSRRLGYGPLVRASTGLTGQWCYPGEPGTFSDGMTVYPDHVAGRIGAIAALALLIRRWRSGKGGTGSVSQAEVMLNHMAVPAAALALHVPVAVQDAPWGVFAAQGEDDWCVVTTRGDADFQALCGVIGRADLATDPKLATRAGRAAQRPLIDAAVSAWVAEHAARDAMAILQQAGVPAGAMLRVSELPEFPHFKARNVFTLVRHPRIAEPFYLETAPVKALHLPVPTQNPAPVVGEHTAEIARNLLGLSEAEIICLADANILETHKEA